MQVIGIYELKTRVAEIMRQVRGGGRFTVTHRGHPVGMLVPIDEADAEPGPDEAWADFWNAVAEIERGALVDPRPSNVILAESRR